MIENISYHITYKEATRSNTAKRNGIKNDPNKSQLKAMKNLAEKVFEPLRIFFDEPIRVNSFFRSEALNIKVGGSKTSQHCKGEAFDIDALNGITNKELFDYILNNLEFDQLIWEYGDEKSPDWIHVSLKISGQNRGQVLRATENGYLKYK